MPAPTTLLLLRHAHTDANDLGKSPRMSGWTNTPLSMRGEAQLASLVPLEGIAPLVYSSTLGRALRTARSAAGERRIIQLRSLREISCGDVDGWMIDDVETQFPELWQRNLAQDDPDFTWPGGESYRRFRWRVLRALRGIASRHEGERVLVVTHAGVISQAIGAIHVETPARWDQFRPRNCTITTMEVDRDGTLRLVEFDAPADAHPHGG